MRKEMKKTGVFLGHCKYVLLRKVKAEGIVFNPGCIAYSNTYINMQEDYPTSSQIPLIFWQGKKKKRVHVSVPKDWVKNA